VPNVPTRERSLALASAAGFAAVFSIGIALTTFNQIPSITDPESLLTSFYADRADRVEVLTGGLMLVGASLLLLLFVSELARTWELRALALAAATLSGAAVCTGAIALALVAGELSLRGAAPPSPELERWLAELGYALILIPGMASMEKMPPWAEPASITRSPPLTLTVGMFAAEA